MSAGIGLVQGFYAALSIPMGSHWLMPEAEAKQFCIVWQNVLRHYPIHITQKAFDWSVCASAMMYLNLPRVMKTVQQYKARGQPTPRPQAQILRFATPGGGGNAGGPPPSGGVAASAVSPGSAGAVTPGASPAELGIMAEGPPDLGAFS